MILTEEQKHYVRIHYHNNPDPLNLAQGVFENPSLSPLSPQVKVVRGFIGTSARLINSVLLVIRRLWFY